MTAIKITDITLRESEQVYAARLSFKEKLETAKLLEKLRVDVIETGYIGESASDAVFIRTLASTMEYSAVCVPVILDRESIDKTWSALSKAKRPRLNLVVPASTVQMEYAYQMKADTVLKLTAEIAAYCVSVCPDTEFTADDAARAEPEFLAQLIKAAADAGVRTITLCDSTGEMLPEELSGFIENVKTAVPQLGQDGLALALHCRDGLGLGSASALAAVNSGIRQIKVSSGGANGTLMLERFLNVIKIRGETLGITTGVNTTALQRTCTQLAALTGSGGRVQSAQSDIGGGETAAPPALHKDTDLESLKNHVAALGYDVCVEDLTKIYTQFQEIAKSKDVDNRDIEALIAETAGQAGAVYRLSNYVINSGSAITATAVVEIIKDGTVYRAMSMGDGPIDAAFLAVEQAIGQSYSIGQCELEEFQIQAVTEGREATGDALVKLRYGGAKLYSGRGVSTDIVAAGIRAYISAVNKIVHEERAE